MRTLSREFYYAFIITLLAFHNLSAQTPPAKAWDKRYGGFRSDNNVYDIQQTPDGGYIVGGMSDSYFTDERADNTEEAFFSEDFWIIRINADGSKVWDKMLGSCGDDKFAALVQTADGGFLIGGSSSDDEAPGSCGRRIAASHGGFDYYIVKINAAGVFQWDAAYGGSGDDMLSDLQPTPDGGYILGGSSSSAADGDVTSASRGADDYWIIKIDVNGNKQWDARFGGSSSDGLSSCRPTSDGGFILGGSSISTVSGDKGVANHSISEADQWVVKINAARVKQWEKAYGSTGNEQLSDIRPTTDGGYIIAGFTDGGNNGDISEPGRGGNDYWLLKIDVSGNKIWDKLFGGNNADNTSTGRAVEQMPDGGYIIGGTSASDAGGDKTQASQGSVDFWIVRTNADGQKRWDVRFGGDNIDEQGALNTTVDGAFILTGTSASGVSGDHSENFVGPPTGDYWILKTTMDPPCEDNCGETTCGKPGQGKIKICHKGKEICVNQNAVNAHVAHGDDVGGCVFVNPNPAHRNVTIGFTSQINSVATVSLYDVTGKHLWWDYRHASKGKNLFNIHLPEVRPGVYIFEVKTRWERFRKKIVIVNRD